MSIFDFVKGIPPRKDSGPSRDDFMSIGGPVQSPRSDADIQALIDKALAGLDRPNFRDDFMSINRRLEELSNRPRFDPSDIQSQLAGLQEQVSGFTPYDPSGLQSQLAGLQDQVSGFTPYDPSGLQSQLAGLQDQVSGFTPYDPSDLQSQLAGLQDQVSGFTPYDPSDMQSQLAGLQEQVSGFTPYDPSDLQSQLAAMQAQFDTFSAPPPPPDDRDDFMSIGGPGGGKPDPTGGSEPDPTEGSAGSSGPTESQLNEFLQNFFGDLFGGTYERYDMPGNGQDPPPPPPPPPPPNYQDYSINVSPQGYNPYLSGQYQSTPYGNAGVPNMGGITTIPVPASYQAPRTMT